MPRSIAAGSASGTRVASEPSYLLRTSRSRFGCSGRLPTQQGYEGRSSMAPSPHGLEAGQRLDVRGVREEVVGAELGEAQASAGEQMCRVALERVEVAREVGEPAGRLGAERVEHRRIESLARRIDDRDLGP